MSTVGKVILAYWESAAVSRKTGRNNALSLLKILEVANNGIKRPAEIIPLTEISPVALAAYQSTTLNRYISELPSGDPSALREARERALRSTRSTITQARSIFSDRGEVDLPSIYKSKGIDLPPCVKEFCSCKVRGKASKREYRAPDDSVVESSLDSIQLMKADRDAYIGFWLALGAGLRKTEIRFCRWEFLREVGGHPRIIGGFGKDGETIDVPLQTRAFESLTPFREAEGFMIRERGDRWARRLSVWMRGQGWQTQKTLHELRAYTGSRIYSTVSPVQAMRFLRHKSIAVTEKNYLRYSLLSDVVDVL